MDKKTIFSQIINKKIKVDLIYQDKYVTAFYDKVPLAPCHILIIPNIYIKNMNKVTYKHIYILGKLLLVASLIAKEKNLSKDGYRIIINCKKYGGQIVEYLHLHLLGGCFLGNMLSLKNK